MALGSRRHFVGSMRKEEWTMKFTIQLPDTETRNCWAEAEDEKGDPLPREPLQLVNGDTSSLGWTDWLVLRGSGDGAFVVDKIIHFSEGDVTECAILCFRCDGDAELYGEEDDEYHWMFMSGTCVRWEDVIMTCEVMFAPNIERLCEALAWVEIVVGRDPF